VTGYRQEIMVFSECGFVEIIFPFTFLVIEHEIIISNYRLFLSLENVPSLENIISIALGTMHRFNWFGLPEFKITDNGQSLSLWFDFNRPNPSCKIVVVVSSKEMDHLSSREYDQKTFGTQYHVLEYRPY
jgi:hypothetical protein